MWGASAASATTRPTKKGSVLGGIATLLGAALAIAGVFTGWVAIDDGTASSSISGWTLTTGDDLLKSNDPYLVLGLGVASLVLGLLLLAGVARLVVRIATILTGIGITAVAALNWASIASYVTDNLPSTFEATTDVGFFLAVAGGVLVAVGGLAPARR
jgi:FtsH-binding integral membrane protein